MYRYDDAEDTWYLDYASFSGWWGPVIIPLRFLLLNSYMIPISLKVASPLPDTILICLELISFTASSGEHSGGRYLWILPSWCKQG